MRAAENERALAGRAIAAARLEAEKRITAAKATEASAHTIITVVFTPCLWDGLPVENFARSTAPRQSFYHADHRLVNEPQRRQ